MKTWRNIVIGLVLLAGIGIFRVPMLGAVSALYNTTVRVVSSTGTVLNGTASAVTANYNSTVRIVDSTGHVIDAFGGGGGPTTNPVSTAQGGTGAALTPTIGDLLYATSSSAFSLLSDVATGSVLCSGGVGVAPSFCSAPAISIVNVTGTLPTGSTAALTGDVTKSAGTNVTTVAKVNGNLINTGFCPAGGTFPACTATAASGTVSCNMALGDYCGMSNSAGGTITVNVPTNGVVGVQYYLYDVSGAQHNIAFATATPGWRLLRTDNNTYVNPPASVATSVVAGTTIITPFHYDGTNYVIDSIGTGSFTNLYVGALTTTNTINIGGGSFQTASGSHTSTTGAIGPTGGGVLQSYGGTVPTCACTGGSPTCTVATAGSNSAGQIQLTGGTAVTTCTLTFSASGTFHAAPICVATDANASITPLAFSVGAVSTSTAVFDFAAATATKFNYHCIGE